MVQAEAFMKQMGGQVTVCEKIGKLIDSVSVCFLWRDARCASWIEQVEQGVNRGRPSVKL